MIEPLMRVKDRSVSFRLATASGGKKPLSIDQAICFACRYVGAVYQLIELALLYATEIKDQSANTVLPKRRPATTTLNRDLSLNILVCAFVSFKYKHQWVY